MTQDLPDEMSRWIVEGMPEAAKTRVRCRRSDRSAIYADISGSASQDLCADESRAFVGGRWIRHGHQVKRAPISPFGETTKSSIPAAGGDRFEDPSGQRPQLPRAAEEKTRRRVAYLIADRVKFKVIDMLYSQHAVTGVMLTP